MSSLFKPEQLDFSVECFKLSIKWTDFINESDNEAFNDVLPFCKCGRWPSNNKESSIVVIILKVGLTKEQLDDARKKLFEIFQRAEDRKKLHSETTQFHLTNEVLIPKKYSGLLIGAKGSRVLNIRSNSGAEFIFIDDLRSGNETPPQGFDRVLIRSSNVHSVKLAREEVEQILVEALTYHHSPSQRHLTGQYTESIQTNGSATVANRINHADLDDDALHVPYQQQRLQQNIGTDRAPLKRTFSDESIFDDKANARNKRTRAGAIPSHAHQPTQIDNQFKKPVLSSTTHASNYFNVDNNTDTEDTGDITGSEKKQQIKRTSTSGGRVISSFGGGCGRRVPGQPLPAPVGNKNSVLRSLHSQDTLMDEALMMMAEKDHTPAKRRRNGNSGNGCIQVASGIENDGEQEGDVFMEDGECQQIAHCVSEILKQGQNHMNQIAQCVTKHWCAASRELLNKIKDFDTKLYKAERKAINKERHLNITIQEKDLEMMRRNCINCKATARDVAFDCGHLLFCVSCAIKFQKCPSCKKIVGGRIPIKFN